MELSRSTFPTYHIVKLFFLRLASPELAVRQRAREGGHNVPSAIIHRRFSAGLRNFDNLYKPVVDEWALYDNSGRKPVLIAEGVKAWAISQSVPVKKDKKRDPDMASAEVAMKRAAQKARARARQVGSGVAVLRDGKIVVE